MSARTSLPSLTDVDRRFARSGRRSARRRARRALRKPVVRMGAAAVAAVATAGAAAALVPRIELGAAEAPQRASTTPAAPCPVPGTFRDEFAEASHRTGVPMSLLAAMAHEESRMDPVARSHAGALGLLQLMPATARELRANPTVPRANVLGGARYLKRMQRRFGSLDMALAAYNAGPARVTRTGGAGPGPASYAQRVQARAAATQGCR